MGPRRRRSSGRWTVVRRRTGVGVLYAGTVAAGVRRLVQTVVVVPAVREERRQEVAGGGGVTRRPAIVLCWGPAVVHRHLVVQDWVLSHHWGVLRLDGVLANLPHHRDVVVNKTVVRLIYLLTELSAISYLVAVKLGQT